ncbi:acetylxylan esterase [Tellurirhabdus rosea]|uniref:acetylxylan esterase n=1 Tax=Tellurirhabdus rosea TaxID=2674997 RepID=UPI0022509C6F|nr:acetylxylan esterase [Tellurirhabdus rosea]
MRQLLRLFFLLPTLALAQPPEKMVKVVVAPDHADWTYKTGEPSRFTISVLRNGVPVKGATVRYELGPEKMEPTKKGTLTLANGSASLDGGTLKSPGFLRLTAVYELDGKEYRNLATTAYDPLSLPPAAEDPADFEAFWNGAKADLAKIPMDARMTLLPERCTENVNVYHLNLQNIGNSRFYGILCVPKKEGKYPALLRVPGAGVRAYNGDVGTAEKGVITLEVGIHGVPVTMEPYVYTNLAAGPLAGYWNSNLDDKDKYYYKRVYLGCVRANDFLMGLPQFDGSTLGVTGGSQGGALSIITAALDSRVKFLGAFYPALSDLTGYLKGRAGGWPHLFAPQNLAFNNKPDKIKTSQYYDVVNFARRVKVPGYYSWGFNDETCPPTSMYAAYNVITAPKTLYLAQETGHWTYPEQTERVSNWLLEQMGGGTLTKK